MSNVYTPQLFLLIVERGRHQCQQIRCDMPPTALPTGFQPIHHDGNHPFNVAHLLLHRHPEPIWMGSSFVRRQDNALYLRLHGILLVYDLLRGDRVPSSPRRRDFQLHEYLHVRSHHQKRRKTNYQKGWPPHRSSEGYQRF